MTDGIRSCNEGVDLMECTPMDVSADLVNVVRLRVGKATLSLTIMDAHVLAKELKGILETTADATTNCKKGESVEITHYGAPTIFYFNGDDLREFPSNITVGAFSKPGEEPTITVEIGATKLGPVAGWTAMEIADSILDIPEVRKFADAQQKASDAFFGIMQGGC